MASQTDCATPLDRPGATTPLNWPWALTSPPAMSSEASDWKGALLRRWGGTSPVMVQPPLDQHYIVMHLGGAKRVKRSGGDSASVETIAECRSLTLVPAGTEFNWHTAGPIAFAHLYLQPQQLKNTLATEFDQEGRDGSLVERVGFRDPVLEALVSRMIEEVECAGSASTLLLDSLLESCLIRLSRRHAPRPIASRLMPVALAPHRLARVLEFVDAHLDRDICLADLVEAAGTGQYHFSHAFRAATGCSPYRYLIARRIEYSKVLLMTSSESLMDVSIKCGFNTQHQFASMFKRLVGIGPKRFRTMLTRGRH
jgi:AraC family transcriptional regulator